MLLVNRLNGLLRTSRTKGKRRVRVGGSPVEPDRMHRDGRKRTSASSGWTFQDARKRLGFDRPAINVPSAEAPKFPKSRTARPWTVEMQEDLEDMGDRALERARARDATAEKD